MKYIVHRPAEFTSINHVTVFYDRGTELEVIGPYIADKNRAVCMVDSDNAYRYMAINDDGKGLHRGELTHAIAYAERKKINKNGKVYRFSEAERAVLMKKWRKYLRDDTDMLLFNGDFFPLQ